MNPLYNILAAYSEYDTEIGYTQGMNYLAALIYIAVGDEVMAFALLTKVMYDLKWREVYADKLIKLMDLTLKIKKWLLREHKTIAVHLDACRVILEAQLSSPFMGLFANIVNMEFGLRVLDRFFFYGERAIIDIVKSSFRSQIKTILGKKESIDLNMYLTRQIYRDAISQNNFLPYRQN
jgi:hypothetical protein